jgi:hypothetical protein
MSPVIKEVNTREELKRAEDAFYSAMFEGDEIEMCQAHAAVGYYESMIDWLYYSIWLSIAIGFLCIYSIGAS